MRFSFVQEYFNLLCSDISDYPVARAVTASSAVPGSVASKVGPSTMSRIRVPRQDAPAYRPRPFVSQSLRPFVPPSLPPLRASVSRRTGMPLRFPVS